MRASANGAGIGQPVRRREDHRLLTGRGCYSDDFNFPDQAYAVMVRSPHPHAVIRSIDTGAAGAAPGVLAVLTGRDLLADGLRAIPHSVGTRHPADITLANMDGSPTFVPEHFPMTMDAAHHAGEIVAMVVATTLAAAKDGAEAVVVDYAALPSVTQALAAVKTDAPLARGDSASNIILDAEVGDAATTDAAFGRAAHIVKLDTWVQRIAGVPMEPRAATGEYDRDTGRYTLMPGSAARCGPRRIWRRCSAFAEDKVRVVMQEVGGNFGTRGAFNAEFALVAWAARRVGRPVKWTCERHEAFLCRLPGARSGRHRRTGARCRRKFPRDARLEYCPSRGAYPIAFGSLVKGIEIMSSIYHMPAVHFRARAALTNTVPTRPYRSSGRPEVMFVMERLIDLAATSIRLRPLELRRRNLVPESAMPYTNPFGMVYDSGEYHKAMERVAGARRLDRVPGPPRRGCKRAADAAASASPITSIPRPARRANAPK